MITRTVVLAAMFFAWSAPLGLYADPGKTALAIDSTQEIASTIFDELERAGRLDVTLTTDLSALQANRKTETYLEAEIRYEVAGQGMVTRPIELRVRGKYRRRVCSFPPLKLKFSEPVLREAGLLDRHRSIKLVTHCIEGESVGNENVLKEYLTYQLYRELTETGYRVQLARIRYVDEQGEHPPVERYGFFIEDTDEMAVRNGGEECNNCYNPQPEDLRTKEATLMWLFQFMIGNADWNMPMMRNLKLVRMPDEKGGILVPYDFDFSGLVNTSYAKPNREAGLSKVRDRIYMGYPSGDRILKWAINYLKFKEDALLERVRTFELLNRESRQDMVNYLSAFFRFLDELRVNKATGIHSMLDEALLKYTSSAAGKGNVLEEQGE